MADEPEQQTTTSLSDDQKTLILSRIDTLERLHAKGERFLSETDLCRPERPEIADSMVKCAEELITRYASLGNEGMERLWNAVLDWDKAYWKRCLIERAMISAAQLKEGGS